MYLTLRQMHYFEAIVAEGSLNRAAARLHVSVTALSLQVKQLEEHTGHKLLIRHAKGVRPTPVGRDFQEKCRQILGLVERVEAELSEIPERLPRFRIGMPPSATRTLGYLFVETWTPETVGFEFELHERLATEDLIEHLRRHDLDVVIGFEISSLGDFDDDISVIDLLDEGLLFITAPDGRPPGRIDLTEAMAAPLLIHSEDEVCWRITRRAAQSAGIDFPPPRVIGSIDVILHIVEDGHGAIVAPRSLVEEQLRRGSLVAHEIMGHPLHRTMSVAIKTSEMRDGRASGLVAQIERIARQYHHNAESIVWHSHTSDDRNPTDRITAPDPASASSSLSYPLRAATQRQEQSN